MNIVIDFMKSVFQKLSAVLYPYCMEDVSFCNALTATVLIIGSAIACCLVFKTIPNMICGIIYRIEEEERRRRRMKVLMRRVRERRKLDKVKKTESAFEFEELELTA